VLTVSLLPAQRPLIFDVIRAQSNSVGRSGSRMCSNMRFSWGSRNSTGR
jgi:hypothetical protein